MAFLPAALAIGGALFSGVSAFGQADYQRQVARRNQQIANDNANLTAQETQINSQMQDRQMAQLSGEQLATQAASGLDVLGQSQLLTRATTRRTRDEGAIRNAQQGAVETNNYFNQAAGFAGQANAAKSAGTAALISSVFKAGSATMDGGMGGSLIGKPKSRKFGG